MLTTKSKTWAFALAALVGLFALGALGVDRITVARAEARTLVDDGQLALKSGDRAHAVLDFERAALLAPRADFVRRAREATDIRAADSWWALDLSWLSAREWSWLALGFGWAAGLGVAASIASQRGVRLRTRLTWGITLLFVAAAASTVQTSRAAQSLAVVKRATGALVAPYAGAGATADLATGMVVSVGARYGDFFQVRGPGGTQGWIDQSALESVVGS